MLSKVLNKCQAIEWKRLGRDIWNKQIKMRSENIKLSYKVESHENKLASMSKHHFEQLEEERRKRHLLFEEHKILLDKISRLQVDYQLLKGKSIQLDHCKSFDKLKDKWIYVWIQKLVHSDYGSGLVYELYKKRKQEAVDAFLQGNHQHLSSNDIKYIKKETEVL